MADRIIANTETYQQISRRLNILSQELGDAASSLSRVNTDQEAGGTLSIRLGGRLNSTGASMPSGQLASCVRSMRSIIRSLRDHAGDLATNVRDAASLFENIEHELARLEPGTGEDAAFSRDHGGDGRKFDHGFTDLISEFVQILFGDSDADQQLILDGAVIGGFVGGALVLPGVFNTTEFLGINLDSIIDSTLGKIVDFDSLAEYKISDFLNGTVANDMASRLHDATSVSAKKSGSVSLFSRQNSVSTSHGSAEAQMAVLKAEGDMSAFAQIFDEDGHFTPGAGAHIGGSATVFEASASGEYEIIDNVKVHGSVDITAGEVSAEAEANIGFDEEGNLNLNAGASIEAIAAEASADVGVNIAGVDVKGKGSVNIGIGAHADVGLKDGVLKVDVGASLGVGASVSLEVDIGEAVDNAKDMVYDGLDKIQGYAESALDFLFS